VTAASLRDSELAELAGLLGFLHDWLIDQHDPLTASMRRFTFGLIGLDEVRGDVTRFACALGADVTIPDDADHNEEVEW
jgi:hypothetical protein